MTSIRILLAVVCVMVTGSCALTYDVHFNSDLSGQIALHISSSTAINNSSAPGALPVPAERINARTAELNNIDGFSNTSFETVGEAWVIKGDFEDLDALNEFCVKTDLVRRTLGDSITILASKNEGIVVLTATNHVPWQKMGMGAAVQSEEEAKLILEMFSVDVMMSFEAPIQSIDVLSAKVTNRDEHSFVAQVDMREFYADGLSISTNIHN